MMMMMFSFVKLVFGYDCIRIWLLFFYFFMIACCAWSLNILFGYTYSFTTRL